MSGIFDNQTKLVRSFANDFRKAIEREQFASLRDLQLKLNDYVWWHNKERMHSTPGYMSPVEFRKAGLSL